MPLNRVQIKAIFGEVKIADIIPAEPVKQFAGWLWVSLEHGYRFPVLRIGCSGVLDSPKVGLESDKILLPNFRPERGYPLVSADGEKEVIPVSTIVASTVFAAGLLGLTRALYVPTPQKWKAKWTTSKLSFPSKEWANRNPRISAMNRPLTVNWGSKWWMLLMRYCLKDEGLNRIIRPFATQTPSTTRRYAMPYVCVLYTDSRQDVHCTQRAYRTH